MRTDALSMAVIVLVIGVLVSGLGLTNVMHKKSASSELQLGFSLTQPE